MPQAAALQHLIDQIRSAAHARTPLQLRGGGSKDFLGTIQPAQRLDTRTYQGILNYAPSELVVTVAAGTPLQELTQPKGIHRTPPEGVPRPSAALWPVASPARRALRWAAYATTCWACAWSTAWAST